MKNKFLFLLVLALSSCSSGIDYKIEPIRVNEVGGDPRHMDKLFLISCVGYDDASEVDIECRKHAAEFAYSKGYFYFTVFNQNQKTETQRKSYQTTQAITTESVNNKVKNTNSSHTGSYSNYKSKDDYTAYERQTDTVYVPKTVYYTVTKNYKQYTFLLIQEKEITDWKNYYKVLDYYSPDEKKKK